MCFVYTQHCINKVCHRISLFSILQEVFLLRPAAFLLLIFFNNVSSSSFNLQIWCHFFSRFIWDFKRVFNQILEMFFPLLKYFLFFLFLFLRCFSFCSLHLQPAMLIMISSIEFLILLIWSSIYSSHSFCEAYSFKGGVSFNYRIVSVKIHKSLCRNKKQAGKVSCANSDISNQYMVTKK